MTPAYGLLHEVPTLSSPRAALTTLGASFLHVSGVAAPVFTGGKPLALITYLSSAPGRSAPREQLVDLLWGEVEREAGRHTLRQTLLHIRRRLGAELLAATPSTIALAIPPVSDRDDFLDALERGDLDRAVTLYAGDFFPGYAAPGGAEFERWADLERARLRALFLRAAAALARQRVAEHRVREAIVLARRVRDASPHEQSGWRLLLECLIAGSDGVAAAATADELERYAATDGFELDPPTRAALRAARQAPRSPLEAEQRTLVAELVGRDREFAAVLAAWNGACRGTPRHLHVVAGAGLGKSRLLGDVAARFRSMRHRVVLVRARPGERDLAYGVVSALVGALATVRGAAGVSPASAATLVDLCPPASTHLRVGPGLPRDTSTTEILRHRAQAIVELLAAVSHEAPIAVLLDDLHWADEPSRRVLTIVRDRCDRLPVLLVTTARPASPASITGGESEILELSTLSQSDVASLVLSIGSLPPECWAEELPDRLWATSGGNPLLVLESIQLALDRGVLTLHQRQFCCADAEELARILVASKALQRRLGRLTPIAQHVLRLLAIAGIPLAERVLGHALADRYAEASAYPDAMLQDLETRGLLSRLEIERAARDGESNATGPAWMVAHDEIADAVLAASSPEDIRAAHRGLGEALAELATRPDAKAVRELRLALRHLAAAESPVLAPAFARLVRAARCAGDHRHPRALATEALGDDAPEPVVRTLVRQLPMQHRSALLRRPAAAVALSASLVVTTGVTVAWLDSRAAPPQAEVILARATGDTTAEAFLLTLSRAGWSDEPLEISGAHAARAAARAAATKQLGFRYTSHVATATSGWLTNRAFPDSGAVDVVLLRPDGRVTRITSAPHDDDTPRWAPDEQAIVFATGRWNPDRATDLAVLTFPDRAVRQLTSGPTADHSALWSPDGTRIAFGRRHPNVRADELCWVAPDGSRLRCTAVPGLADMRPVAWWDRHTILLSAERTPDARVLVPAAGGERVLAAVSIAAPEVRIIDAGATWYSVSPDAQWVACGCAPPGYTSHSTFVFPMDLPQLKRPVVRAGTRVKLDRVVWGPHARSARALQQVVIATPVAPVPAGLPVTLRVVAFDSRGDPAPVDHVTWTSMEPTASIDSAGVMVARRPGGVRIVASADGWRADTVRLEVTADTPVATVLGEDWRSGPDARWRRYGWPRPTVVRGPEGVPSFLNAGDGTHTSGAYSRLTIDPRRGAGVEARISAAISDVKWQTLGVSLLALPEPSLRVWDHRSGAFPDHDAPHERGCKAAVPAGEGAQRATYIAITAGARSTRLALGAILSRGAWYTIRLQIFPDGRCGLAVDGRVLAVLDAQMPLDRPMRLVLDGNSVGTRMLVGPLRAWEGVDLGVDWFAARRTGSPSSPP